MLQRYGKRASILARLPSITTRRTPSYITIRHANSLMMRSVRRMSSTVSTMEQDCPTVIPDFPTHIDASTDYITDDAYAGVMEHVINECHLRSRGQTNKCIAIGVSGGADSMALLILTQRWAREHGYRTVAIIVDHKLREESGVECNVVQQWARSIGVDETVVREIQWEEGWDKENAFELHSRRRRHDIFDEECAKLDIDMLFTGHHLNDSVETFVMRTAFGSGIHGLSGIPFIKDQPKHVAVARPLIAFPRYKLEATCKFYNQRWVEDPTNRIANTPRNEVRRTLPKWEEHGITTDRISELVSHIIDVRSVLVHQMTHFFSDNVHLDKVLGYAVIERRAFLHLPLEIAGHVLANILQWITNSTYTPVTQAIMSVKRIPTMKERKYTPIQGCYLHLAGKHLYVVREHLPIEEMPSLRLKFGESGVWDQRFYAKVEQFNYNLSAEELEREREKGRLTSPSQRKMPTIRSSKTSKTQYQNERIPSYDGTVDTDPNATLIVRRLTTQDWIDLTHKYPPIKDIKHQYPLFLRHSLPVIVDKESKEILAVPFIGYQSRVNLFFDVHFESRHHAIPIVEYEYLSPTDIE